MVNAARMHAQQEYDRIMQLVSVLQQQADDIRRRLDITDMVRAAKYEFQTYHGQIYWLVKDNRHDCTRLVHTGPADWSTGVPEGYEYICQVKWLGDYTWQEVA
jgi:prefoldin subunit 5